VRVIRTGGRRRVRRRDLDTGMIPPRANTPGAFVRSTSRGFIRYGNGLRALDEAGLPPQHIPAPVERATTGELVPTAASDDAKEVTP
jgi:hypothetical protein